MYVHHVQAVPVEVRRGLWGPGNWSYGRLGATMWVLESEFRYSGRAPPALNS